MDRWALLQKVTAYSLTNSSKIYLSWLFDYHRYKILTKVYVHDSDMGFYMVSVSSMQGSLAQPDSRCWLRETTCTASSELYTVTSLY